LPAKKTLSMQRIMKYFVFLHLDMKKTIYNKYDKKLIAALPVVAFNGRIVVVLSAHEAERAVDFLLSQPILGLDTETRPAFHRGQQHKVALLQVATHDICFLFRLNYLGLSPAIIRLLEDTTVPKIGLSWHDDLNMLHHLGNFNHGYFIDLQQHVKEIGIEDMSLQKLYANMFGQKISKRQQLTNWEADVLSDKQKLYAATDAWACIQLYEELMRLEATGDYELIIQPQEKEEE
jgi:ribonuclease D